MRYGEEFFNVLCRISYLATCRKGKALIKTSCYPKLYVVEGQLNNKNIQFDLVFRKKIFVSRRFIVFSLIGKNDVAMYHN